MTIDCTLLANYANTKPSAESSLCVVPLERSQYSTLKIILQAWEDEAANIAEKLSKTPSEKERQVFIDSQCICLGIELELSNNPDPYQIYVCRNAKQEKTLGVIVTSGNG